MKKLLLIITIVLVGFIAQGQNKGCDNVYKNCPDKLGQFRMTDLKIETLSNIWNSREYKTFNNSLDKDQFYIWKSKNKYKEFHNCLSSDYLIVRLNRKNKINSISINTESYKYWTKFKEDLKTYNKEGQVTKDGITYERYTLKKENKTIYSYLFGESKDRFLIIKEYL